MLKACFDMDLKRIKLILKINSILQKIKRSFRVCHGFRLAKRDDYLKVNFDLFLIHCCF